jgi:O-antigen/teichoic acid export membrane protein
MTSQTEKIDDMPPAKRLIFRFAHLLSALGVEGILSTLFFIYLAWLDAAAYGEIMYAMAAGSVVLVGIRFGLYYPLVAELGKAGKEKIPGIINRVNIIKLALLVPSMICVYGVATFRWFSPQMAWILFFVSLGFSLEAIAETFFADFRVRGRQDIEARIKIAGTALGYGYGFLSAAIGFDPVIISLFVLVSSVVRLAFGIGVYVKTYSAKIFIRPQWRAIWNVFRAAIVFAMIDNLGNLYNKTNVFFLEKVAGVKGVAFYSATWTLVDAIAKLASEQFLGWVIFPVLSTLWWKKRGQVGSLVRTNALWLMAIAFPIMFFLHMESDLIIGIIYPGEYKDAVWMQKYLVWTIPFTFEGNLFAYVMMVAGAARVLLVFAVVTTLFNLLYNTMMVQHYGLAGCCLVIVLTKLTMTILTFSYCQARFHFFKLRDFLFPIGLAGVSLGLLLLVRPLIGLQLAVAVTIGFYFIILWKLGMKFLGDPPKGSASNELV